MSDEGTLPDPADGRRHAIAREVVRILSRAVDPSVLDIQLADGSSRASGADDVTGGQAATSERRARARVVVNGPTRSEDSCFPRHPTPLPRGSCAAISGSRAMSWRRSMLARRSTCAA